MEQITILKQQVEEQNAQLTRIRKANEMLFDRLQTREAENARLQKTLDKLREETIPGPIPRSIPRAATRSIPRATRATRATRAIPRPTVDTQKQEQPVIEPRKTHVRRKRWLQTK